MAQNDLAQFHWDSCNLTSHIDKLMAILNMAFNKIEPYLSVTSNHSFLYIWYLYIFHLCEHFVHLAF